MVSPAASKQNEYFHGADFISMRDVGRDQILELLEHCRRFESVREPLLAGKVLGSLFFEPSTRMRLSFESAMKRLGGQTLGFADLQSSSTMKGESLWDTIRVVEGYCDVIVIRHPQEGSARLAAEATMRPVINGGDGSNQHPTQTLLDLYTLVKRAGHLEGLKVAFVGDLMYGRTVHSLIRSLAHFNCKLYLISPSSLNMPSHILEDLREESIEIIEGDDIEGLPQDLDVLYLTRIQKERFPDPIEFERVRNSYQIGPDNVARFGDKLILMHPLPRTNEMDPALDSHPGCAYFDQAHNGVVVRKTILGLVLGTAG